MKSPLSLTSSRDFRRVMSAGHHRRTAVGVVFVGRSESPDQSARLGLAVPAAVSGAVGRNRIKRRLRAAYRSSGPRTGVDVVLRANRSAKVVPFQELENVMSELSSGES